MTLYLGVITTLAALGPFLVGGGRAWVNPDLSWLVFTISGGCAGVSALLFTVTALVLVRFTRSDASLPAPPRWSDAQMALAAAAREEAREEGRRRAKNSDGTASPPGESDPLMDSSSPR
mmetsp:Transcript_42825/g.100756  ORF Transcript_42825/g.100756 Transcript_42825/m.100756 type:complete len:119 (+) Transcript_42825:139-495(+)